MYSGNKSKKKKKKKYISKIVHQPIFPIQRTSAISFAHLKEYLETQELQSYIFGTFISYIVVFFITVLQQL